MNTAINIFAVIGVITVISFVVLMIVCLIFAEDEPTGGEELKK